MKEIHKVNVTIIQRLTSLESQKWSYQPPPSHFQELNETVDEQMDEIIQQNDDIAETTLIHKISTTLLTSFAVIGMATTFIMGFKLYIKIIHMKSEINQLRPTL